MTKLRRNSDNKPEAASKRNAKKEVDVVKKDLFKNLKKIGKKKQLYLMIVGLVGLFVCFVDNNCNSVCCWCL